MWKWTKKQSSKSVIAIDIRADSLQIVHMVGMQQEKYGSYEVKAYYHRAWKAVDEQIDWQMIEPYVDEIIDELALEGAEVMMAVPQSCVTSKLLTIEHGLSAFEMEHYLRLDMESWVSFPLDEMSFDYWTLSDTQMTAYPQLPSERYVQAIACHQSHIAERVAFMAHYAVTLTAIETEQLALQRTLQQLELGFPVGVQQTWIIEIQAYQVTCYAYQSHHLVYSKSYAFTVPPCEADAGDEQALFYSMDKQQEFEQLIYRAIQFYQSTEFARPIDYVLLSGSILANAPYQQQHRQFEQYLQTFLHCRVEVINPLLFIQASPALKVSLEAQQTQLAVPLGLCLWAFDE